MRSLDVHENPYVLLTPGPLSTTLSVKSAMLRDWCTWDRDYNDLVQQLRGDLVELVANQKDYTAVLMQGSGTFAVESVIGSVIPTDGKLLVLSNGAYGRRIAEIAAVLKINYAELNSGETSPIDMREVEGILSEDECITHVALVHCETTTGMLNNLEGVAALVKKFKKVFIVDAMSSMGGIPIDMVSLGIDYLISSSNKCIQGVPGFGVIIAKREALSEVKGIARSLSLDLYSQWKTMEDGGGKWRFTSPTHVVRAFIQAMHELKEEGGVSVRATRYASNQKMLVAGMERLGFSALLEKEYQSPIITSFLYPEGAVFEFVDFYEYLKERGYVIYPGKISEADTFRIGNIGEVYEEDIEGLLDAVTDFTRP